MKKSNLSENIFSAINEVVTLFSARGYNVVMNDFQKYDYEYLLRHEKKACAEITLSDVSKQHAIQIWLTPAVMSIRVGDVAHIDTFGVLERRKGVLKNRRAFKDVDEMKKSIEAFLNALDADKKASATKTATKTVQKKNTTKAKKTVQKKAVKTA